MKLTTVVVGVLISIVVCGIIVMLNPPHDTVFTIYEEEIHFLNQRRSFYPNKLLGKLLENKVSVYFSHYLTNISYGLDPNFYFFASHPRERAGFSEHQRLPLWLFPLSLAGLFMQLTNGKYILVIYFLASLLIISFFAPFDNYAFVLYPFFILAPFTWLIG